MAEAFKLQADFGELRKLETFFKFKSKAQMVAAMRALLNDEAFAVMNMAKKSVIPRMFNIRGAWIQSSIHAQKAKKTTVAAQLLAIAGARSKWGRNTGEPFMGMRHQEFGRTFQDPDMSTIAARTGKTFKKKVRGKDRFNRLGDIVQSNEFRGKSRDHRVIVMIRTLEKRNYKGAFFVRKHKRIKKGIYRFAGGSWKGKDGKRHKNIAMIKNLENKTVRIPAKPWLQTSTKKAVNKNTVVRFWRRNAKRFTTKTR